jgi:hypothetical protein
MGTLDKKRPVVEWMTCLLYRSFITSVSYLSSYGLSSLNLPELMTRSEAMTAFNSKRKIETIQTRAQREKPET